MQKKEHQYGNDAVEEGNGDVCHRHAGEIRYDQRDDEFKGLHFPDLALSHKAHDDDQRQIDDQGAETDD